MAGPWLGPRPANFDEQRIRVSFTFRRRLLLPPGSELTCDCRTFMRGEVDNEERLMRRIMIARRNNLRDHGVLRRARGMAAAAGEGMGEGR
jgi:hypothetical protein